MKLKNTLPVMPMRWNNRTLHCFARPKSSAVFVSVKLLAQRLYRRKATPQSLIIVRHLVRIADRTRGKQCQAMQGEFD